MSKVGISDKIKVEKILNVRANCTIFYLPFNVKNYYEVLWFEKNGIRFNKYNIIFFDIEDNIPKFFKIINIFHYFENKFECIFICQELIIIQYDSL